MSPAAEGVEGDVLLVGMLSQFLDMWRAVSQQQQHSHNASIGLRPGEGVLKVAPLVRVTELGFGTLLLTHQRLFMVKVCACMIVNVCVMCACFVLMRVLRVFVCVFVFARVCVRSGCELAAIALTNCPSLPLSLAFNALAFLAPGLVTGR